VGHTFEIPFAYREHGSWFVIWHSLDDREPGKQICRQQSLAITEGLAITRVIRGEVKLAGNNFELTIDTP
jgi:hypothetical protein